MSDDYSYNSEQAIRERASEKKREDAADFYNEVAGRENGRTSRFLTREEREKRSGKKAPSQASISPLDLLLMDPEYREAYEGLLDLLSTAEQQTQQAIDQAEIELERARDALDDIQGRASTLPDGRRVYRDKNGNVFNEDGQQIQSPDTDAIIWKENSPSYEDYLTRKKAVSDWRQYLHDLSFYQTDVLGDARDRISDPGTPPSLDEIRDIETDIIEKAPPAIRSRLQPDAGSLDTPDVATATMDIPTL